MGSTKFRFKVQNFQNVFLLSFVLSFVCTLQVSDHSEINKKSSIKKKVQKFRKLNSVYIDSKPMDKLNRISISRR